MAQGSRQVQTQAQQQIQTLSPQQILVVKLLELPCRGAGRPRTCRTSGKSGTGRG